jgi:hypothetical protein
MKDPTVLGNWLAARVKFAAHTSARLNKVSRVDAICWYLTHVGCLATRADIITFATAFRTTSGEVGCYSLLNTCYGGVGRDFSGAKFGGGYRCGNNYGPLAPLYRPFKAQYSPTLDGVRRGANVQDLLNGSLAS